MIKRSLFCVIAIGLFLAGCVSIPDHHGTAGKYNESGDINTECLTKDNILPPNDPAVSQQIDELDSRGFRVLNWNSHKGSNNEWQEDIERLSSRSDLIVLQEAYLTDVLQGLLNKNQYTWDITKAFTYNDIYTGVLTASRIKPDFLCSFRVPEPLSGIPKTVLVTRYPLAGTDASLVMVNIHMINFSLGLSAYRAQLEEIVEVVSQHRGPLIVAGDFNTWNAERLKALTEFTQELGAKAVTFATDNRVTFMGKHLDHILYRQLVPHGSFTEKVTTSDHNPMLVTFRLADDV
jgi:endonuclease/exonuclease/phosphatase (EEP) superfamily protein YafD